MAISNAAPYLDTSKVSGGWSQQAERIKEDANKIGATINKTAHTVVDVEKKIVDTVIEVHRKKPVTTTLGTFSTLVGGQKSGLIGYGTSFTDIGDKADKAVREVAGKYIDAAASVSQKSRDFVNQQQHKLIDTFLFGGCK